MVDELKWYNSTTLGSECVICRLEEWAGVHPPGEKLIALMHKFGRRFMLPSFFFYETQLTRTFGAI